MAGEGMPVKRTSLVDQLVSTIQHELITGQYPAGTAFVEEDVKTRYNVSRSTTREALVRLEEDGFLSRDLGTRTLRFRTLTEEEIRDVYYARRFYEGSGACVAAEFLAVFERNARKGPASHVEHKPFGANRDACLCRP